MNILVIADDLSGAMECAAHYAYAAPIQVSVGCPEGEDDPGELTIVCLDVRYAAPSHAADIISGLLENRRYDYVYLKIDSALRGNVATYAQCLLSGTRHPIGVVAALPEQHRIVENGVILISGKPLHETDIWNLESSACPATVRAALCNGNTLPQDAQLENNTVIPDLATVSDVRSSVKEMVTNGITHFMGTSTGCAALLSLLRPSVPATNLQTVDSSTTLCVVGSGSRQSHEQLNQMHETLIFDVDPERINIEVKDYVKTSLATKSVGIYCGSTNATQNPQIARGLARLAKCVSKSDPSIAIIATGGETAGLILEELNFRHLYIYGAVEPGAVWGRLPNGRFIGVKPGSHGSSQALEKLRVQALN